MAETATATDGSRLANAPLTVCSETCQQNAAPRGAAAYDGLGSDDYEAVTGKVWLNFPLN